MATVAEQESRSTPNGPGRADISAASPEAPAERSRPPALIVLCKVCGSPLDADRDEDGICPVDDSHRGWVIYSPRQDARFPADSLKEAAPFLRRPFTKEAVKWKVQANMGSDSGLVVGHLDARLVIERLNLVVPHLWFANFEGTNDSLMLCRLTVDGVTREDVGEGKGKALRSDALKRAAVHFGIGVSVYAIPKVILKLGEGGGLKEVGQKKNRVITVGGLKICADAYEKWLTETGIPHFGEPIDHGDVEDSAGDEADQPEDDAPASDLPAVDMPLTDEKADQLRAHCRALYAGIKKSTMPKPAFESNLRQASVSYEELEAFAARLEGLAK